MSTFRTRTLLLAGFAVIGGLAAAPAYAAGVSLDFLTHFDPTDDVHVLLQATQEFFHAPEPQIVQAAEVARRPEEVAVVLFIAQQAKVDVAVVAARRADGARWTRILSELNVSRDRLYVELPPDVGPPYAKAFGHERNRSVARASFTDDDVVDLVGLKVAAGYFGQQPISIVRLRNAGQSFAGIHGNLYRARQEARQRGPGDGADELPLLEPSEIPAKGHGTKSR